MVDKSIKYKIYQKCYFFIFIISFLFPIQVFSSQTYQENQTITIEKIHRGIEIFLARDYGQAEIFLKTLITDRSNELLGYFGFMALYQVRNLENYDFQFDPPYREWEAKGRPMAQQILRNSSATPLDLLIAGSALGVSGFYRAHNGRWLAALRDGITGVHALERSFEKDPSLVDSLLGTGLYDYWRSDFTKRLRFLPFFPDRRLEGKEKLGKVAREGRFAVPLAQISLAFIAMTEKKFEEALAAAHQLLARYPRNVILRLIKVEALIGSKKFQEALAEIDLVSREHPRLTKAWFFAGMAHRGLWKETKDEREKNMARESLQKFLSVDPSASSEWKKPAEAQLKELDS